MTLGPLPASQQANDAMSQPPSRRRSILRWALGATVAALAVLIAAGIAFVPSDDDIRRRLERTLSARFDADVTLDDLDVSLLPKPKIEGAGLKLVPRNNPKGPPLLTVRRFTAHATWLEVLLRPRRVNDVALQGMRITIAPKPGSTGIREKERGGCQGDRQRPRLPDREPGRPSPVVIERLVAQETTLEMLPRQAGKLPRRFDIATLTARRITLDLPFEFDAVLTNPTPRGQITTSGRFGPWVAGDPGLSPVEGRYLFENANLGTINGIGGILRSTGRFEGVLQQILVAGSTETPDFSLDTSDRPLPLQTEFEACVDGTDGDTYLDAIRARLASTPIEVKGKVEGQVGVKGRTVALEAVVQEGRIEDMLRLAAKGEPVIEGPISLTTTLLLPPGTKRVVERLQLDGRFGLERTTFTAGKLQGKIDELSRRARGRPKDGSASNVASDFEGRFTLRDGGLRLQRLSFTVPGARVRLQGRYGLVDERIAMVGTARLDAKVSKMTTGFKSVLLKAIDPLFSRKDAGTVLPIRVSGTRSQPKFGVDMKGALLRKAK